MEEGERVSCPFQRGRHGPVFSFLFLKRKGFEAIYFPLSSVLPCLAFPCRCVCVLVSIDRARDDDANDDDQKVSDSSFYSTAPLSAVPSHIYMVWDYFVKMIAGCHPHGILIVPTPPNCVDLHLVFGRTFHCCWAFHLHYFLFRFLL